MFFPIHVCSSRVCFWLLSGISVLNPAPSHTHPHTQTQVRPVWSRATRMWSASASESGLGFSKSSWTAGYRQLSKVGTMIFFFFSFFQIAQGLLTHCTFQPHRLHCRAQLSMKSPHNAKNKTIIMKWVIVSIETKHLLLPTSSAQKQEKKNLSHNTNKTCYLELPWILI